MHDVHVDSQATPTQLHDAVWTWARATPDAIAITDRGRCFTYRQLAEQADALAARLRRAGVGAQTRVALAAARSAELVIGLVAILRAGGAYVPIDPSYPAERRAAILADADCPVIVTDRQLLAGFSGCGRRVITLEPPDTEPATVLQTDSPAPAGTADALAYVIYTSGSTGTPNGVMITHANVLRLFASTAQWFGFGPKDVWTFFHSLAFDFSVWEIWGALLYGGRLVIVPYQVSRDPLAFRRLVRTEGVTVLNQTPSAFRPFLQADALEPTNSQDTLRLIIFGGEALDFRTLRPWFGRHGDVLPRLVNMYGITETTVHVTYRPITAADADDPRSLIGVALPDLTLHLLDQQGRPAAVDEIGELWIGGPGVARGYLDRPTLERERFVPDPLSTSPEARLYRSGDLARRSADGQLEYLGRNDQQVKVRGFRVELGEIETVLRDAAGVIDAAVAAQALAPDQELQLVGYVVAQAEPLDLDQVRAYLEKRLPAHLLPTALVPLTALPLTVNGKLDRRALPAPVRSAKTADVTWDTAEESAIGTLFREVLGTTTVGPDSHFFECGGSSLLAMKLTLRIAERLGYVLPVGAVFTCPTVRMLAGALGSARRRQMSPATSAELPPGQQWTPLSFAQEPMWFMQALVPEQSVFACPLVFRLRGPLDGARLSAALDAVSQRHPLLRAVFTTHDGKPRQQTMPQPTFHLVCVDSDADSVAASVQHTLTAPFDLATAAGRALLLRVAADQHVLVIVLHHLITDGWSLMRLLEELSLEYAGVTVAPPGDSFFAYTRARRDYLVSGQGAAEAVFWRAVLADAPEPNTLLTDLPRPAHASLRGELVSLHLSDAHVSALATLARSECTTTNTVFLAGLYALLSRYTGQRDQIIGVPYADRTAAHSDTILGPLINQLAVRVAFTRDTSFRALITKTHDGLRDACAHGTLPFSQVTAAIGRRPDPRESALWQVVFAPQPAIRDALQLTNITADPLVADARKAHADLTVYLWPRGAGIDAEIEFATDLFARSTVEQLGRHLLRLLEVALHEPDCAVAKLDFFTEVERRQLLMEWPHTDSQRTDVVTLPAIFARQAAARPDAEALRYGEKSITYRELDERASRIAHCLRTFGVGPETLVALSCPRSPEAVAGILGIWKAGGAYLALDPAYPAARLQWMLTDSRATLLLTTRTTAGLEPLDLPTVFLDDDQQLADQSPLSPAITQQPGDLAYVTYTSGSTGEPNGVAVEHRGLANLCAGAAVFAPLPSGGRIAQLAPLSFDAWVHELAAAFCHAAPLVIPTARHPLGGVELLDFLEHERITQALIVPAVLEQLPARALPDLKVLIAAGERCGGELVDRWSAGRTFQNNYGPTEASVCASVHPCVHGEGNPPIGRPLAATALYVFDDGGQPAPIGVRGELYIGGPGVARGYLHRPALTAEKFIDAMPLLGQPGRLYRTGDRVLWRRDGRLEFLGRSDDQHKVRGCRVELGELESVLRAHPGVQSAAASVEGAGAAARLVTYVVPRPTAAPALTLWPSVAEHFVYDELMYLAMRKDTFRNSCYHEALRQHAAGKVVVDLGTGGEAILARLAIAAGAARVYAVEVLAASYQQAVRTVTELGLADRIHVLHADAATVTLPEPADVCVSELVGAIGGSEGAAFLLNSARRLLAESGVMIPCRSLTRIAAVRIPSELTERPHFAPTAASYVDKIFAEVGRPFDLRVCLRGVRHEHLVSSVGVFEDLQFTGPVPLTTQHDVTLHIEKSGPVSGLLLWLELYTGAEQHIDILEHQDSWLPVFLPLTDSPLELPRGAELRLQVSRRPSPNGRNPDYTIQGELHLPDGSRQPVRYDLPHIASTYGGNTFYHQLWQGRATASAQRGDGAAPEATPAALRAYLRQRLPSHLVPSEVIALDALPLLPSGKLDRRRLPTPSLKRQNVAAQSVAPPQESAAVVARIWCEVLGYESGHTTNFFDAGGTSLLLVEVQEKLAAASGRRIGLSSLFERPTIGAMATLLTGSRDKSGDLQQQAAARAALSARDRVLKQASRRVR